MPPLPARLLTSAHLRRLLLPLLVTGVSFARGMAAAPASPGRTAFTAYCIGCHAVGVEGGKVGPALDGIGARHDAAWIRRKIVNPAFNNPKTTMPAMPLAPRELDPLVAWLAALKPPAPPTPKPITPKPPAPVTPPAPKTPSEEGVRIPPLLPVAPPEMIPSHATLPTLPLSAASSPFPPPATRVGSAACLPCHAQVSREFQRTVHSDALMDAHKFEKANGVSGCETCHGPGSRHVATADPRLIQNPNRLTPRHESELCLRCHTGQVSTHDWRTSAHGQAGVSCGRCHQVMKQVVSKLLRLPANELCMQCHRREAAEFQGVSHHPVPEGRMQCVDCHNPHSGVNDAMLRRPANDQCVTCHAEKQGPFEFEHAVVSGGFTEGCMACHSPHGSPFKGLRRMAGRGLCLQCHSDKAVRHYPATSDCSAPGCHVQIHGSHDDPLFLR